MAITYVAFIDCKLYPDGRWSRPTGISVSVSNNENGDIYQSLGADSEIRLVDLKNDRRYFNFHKQYSRIRIINNVLVFDDSDAEELAIDESKKFPKKKRMDE